MSEDPDFLALLDGPQRPTAPFVPSAPGRDVTKYAAAALAGEVANLLAVPIGQGRNHQLNVSAFKMGGYIAAGAIDERTVIEHLGAADGGLDYKATRDTIRSGIEAGKQSPKSIPESERPTSWALQPDSSTGLTISTDPFNPHFVSAGLTGSGMSHTSAPMGADVSGDGATVQSARTSNGTGTETVTGTGALSLADKVRAHLPIIDWAKLWLADTHEEWIVYPILPARRLVAIYSPPKVGKSLILLEVAVAVSQGSETLGHNIDRARTVLYVDFENDPEGDIRPRLINMGYAPADLDNLCYLSYPALSVLDSEQGAAELVAACQVYGAEVVVIDTVSRSVGGEENDNDTWIKFYRHTGLELKRLRVALIRLDHTGKDETKGQRGGSAKSGDVDAVWRMARLTDGSDGSPETFRLICEANRFPIPAGDKILTLERHEGPLRHVPKAVGAKDNIVNAIVAYLDRSDIPLSRGRSIDLLAEVKAGGVAGASKPTLEAALKLRKALHAETDES